MAASYTRVVTPPATEPVTLAEAKLWCRIDDDITDQDAVVLMLIAAMRTYAENLTGRAFMQRGLEMRLDCFPSGAIQLPYPPLVSVDYVRYIDTSGVLQDLHGSPQNYQTDTFREPGYIAPLYAGTWPAVRADLYPVRIGFTAGYANRNALPTNLKLWMSERMATAYEYREQIIAGTIISDLPRPFVDGLLDDLVIGTRLF